VTGIAAGLLRLAGSHSEGGLVPFLRHPWLASFLHRPFLSAVLSFVAIVAVSLLTAPPPAGVLAGTFSFSWRAGEGESRRHLRSAALWMAALFIAVTALFWLFR